jgi:copper chaperone NosL
MRSGNIASAIAILAVVLVGGCGRNEMTAAPSPQDPGPDDTSVTCNMTLIDHPGPKGQIFLKGQTAPLWFSSARDAIAFTLLPEEPKQIMAIYVNDMGKANWDRPEPGTWIDAKIALYVIGSERMGGMGTAEAVPFADKASANQFAARYRGRVVAFNDIPDDYVLGADATEASTAQAPGQPKLSTPSSHPGGEP